MKFKEIHCFGTSITGGGGFEFFNENYDNKFEKYYTDKPYTQFNYTWPGQLQKLVENNCVVYNHAKPGYGNERMYRIAFDIIMNNDVKDKLFIFEFSHVGRKEYWSNTFQNYFIVNYGFDEKNPSKPHVNGLAETYSLNNNEYIKQLGNIVIPFIKETMNYDVQESLVKMNNEFFINFLLSRDINFYIISNPEYSNIESLENKLIYLIDKDNKTTLYLQYFLTNKLSIRDETNGEIDDWHPGLKAAKDLAKLIKNKICN